MKNRLSYKLKLLAFTGAVGCIISSCEVTDLLPADIIPDSEAFATLERTESTVFGVYESAQRGFYNGSVVNGRGYPFGAANVEQGEMRGEDMFNDQLFYEITYAGNYDPNTANNNGMWISLYRVINRANIVMEALDPALAEGVLTQEIRDQFMGEMLYIRALSHHELLIHFSRPYADDPSELGIPYRTFAINDVPKVVEGEAVPRGTVGEDYAQLLADLELAESLLPVGTDPATDVFRAKKGAAIALKARVKLHMGDWQGVLAEYSKLTDYAVTANPQAPFRGITTDNIFSFGNSAESNGTVNGALASMLGNPAIGGRGLVKISPLIWRADFWHPEDSRRTLLTSSNVGGIYSEKYIDPVTNTDPNPILRFSEIVLSAAEANARLGNLDQAVALLNQIRDRALPAGVASFTVGSLGSQDQIISAILQERRIELLGEGKRWSDIHRLSGEGRLPGIPPKATTRSITSIDYYTGELPIPTSHSLPYGNHLFVWPIPLQEIQNNSSAPLEQNPGY